MNWNGRFVVPAHALYCGVLILCNCVACETTTTPAKKSQWLSKSESSLETSSAAEQTVTNKNGSFTVKAPVDSALATQNAPSSLAQNTPAKPWDVPAAATQSKVLAPSPQQLSELLRGATWINIGDNGMRRSTLQLNADETFVAQSEGSGGESPAFEGLVVRAKGKWSVKEDGLRLIPNAGDTVVVRLQWLGDKRLVMFNGESWIRTP